MENETDLMQRLKRPDPVIMGIVNVTPDSFSDGGKYFNENNAIEHGLQMIRDGAEVLDVGGESTRPGAEAVDLKEEIRRIVPVIEELKKHAKWVSVDSRNADTMEAALAAGANIINDISALTHDCRSVEIASSAKVPVILMHMQGTPQTMQNNPSYYNAVNDIYQYLQLRIEFCISNRIEMKNIILDPGIGFGKMLDDNLLILRNIREFMGLGCPILLGTSKKSFIGHIVAENGGEPISDRLPGSLSSALWGLTQGVQMFRVHDVKETAQAFKVYQAISESGSS